MAITETTADGMPNGVYSAVYYRIAQHGAYVTRQRGGDSGLSASAAQATAKDLREDEVMVAECQSQPGGLVAYGSERAREVWRTVQRREERARVAELESQWTYDGSTIQVRRAHQAGHVVVAIDGVAKVYRPDEIWPVTVSPAAQAVWSEIRRRAVALIGAVA